jgi:hypothetical protein
MHVRIGVITLHLSPDAISDLVSTLGQAIAMYASRRLRRDTAFVLPTTPRAKA